MGDKWRIRKEGLLTGRNIRPRRTRPPAIASANAEAQTLQRSNIRLQKWLREYTSGQFLASIRRFYVAARAVRHAVEYPHLVINCVPEKPVVQHGADVVVGRHFRGK